MLCCGRALTQEQPPLEEISVLAERQVALETQALTLSETPGVGPHLEHPYAIIGLGPRIAPIYDGSKAMKASLLPYIDVRGLFDDRVFFSDVEGLGLKVLNDGPARAGVTVNYSRGRTSSDDFHLTGLPNIAGAAQVGGYLAYVLRPVGLEARVQHRLGSASGTQVSFGGSVSAAPTPQFHVSLSAEVTWTDASYNKTFFGVTAAEAAQATVQGNPLTPYTPGSGLNSVALTGAGVYQLGDHWGLIARVGLRELVGKSVKDSPLTQRTFQPNIAFGAAYKF
jgi:outer membrane protein